MEINNNINAMKMEEIKLNNSAKDIANPKTYMKDEETDIEDSETTQEVTPDLIKSITEQIPIPIAYKANGNSIQVQDEVLGTTINLKA